MNIKKTKLIVALAGLGFCFAGAQIASAGTLEVNVGAAAGNKIPTFSTDISGPNSDSQKFFAADNRWSPGVVIPTGASVRFNLGGNAADGPAQFATNDISVDNFVLNVGVASTVGIYTAANTRLAVGSYTNGDAAAGWFSDAAATVALGRIFNTTTAGGIGAFDVTVTLNPSISTVDSVTLSLNTGKYVSAAGVPVPFATGPYIGTEVDITNLKKQGFDAAGAALPMYVSIQQGGVTLDSTGGNGNSTIIARSAAPLTLTGRVGQNLLITAASLPTTIDTASTELRFSTPAAATAAGWFNNVLGTNVRYNHLGSFVFNTTTTSLVTYDHFAAGALLSTGQVSDPTGVSYALTALDTLAVTVTGNTSTSFAAFQTAGSGLFLRNHGVSGVCSAATVAGDVSLTETNGTAGALATAVNSVAALTAGTTYNLCAISDNATALETVTVTLGLTLNNVEPTYQDPVLAAVTLSSWIRNGCNQTFFNVPAGSAATADQAFLRFTNTTANTVAGTVRVSAYHQDGSVVGSNSGLLSSAAGNGAAAGLVGHETGVYTSADVASALGVTDDWTGRIRVVMSGGFLSCEGQNMIRSPNGTVTNITSTTSSNTHANASVNTTIHGNNSN